jgi:hypothetical protein
MGKQIFNCVHLKEKEEGNYHLFSFYMEVNMEYLLFALFYFSRFAIVGVCIVWLVWKSVKK